PGGRLYRGLHQDARIARVALPRPGARRPRLPLRQPDLRGADRRARRNLGARGPAGPAGAGRDRAADPALPAGRALRDLTPRGAARDRYLGNAVEVLQRPRVRQDGPAVRSRPLVLRLRPAVLAAPVRLGDHAGREHDHPDARRLRPEVEHDPQDARSDPRVTAQYAHTYAWRA